VTKEKRVGRKRQPPDATSGAWHAKLARLIDDRRHYGPICRRVALTDAEIAAQAGLTPTRLSHILSGQVDPRLSEITAILAVLDCTIGEWDRA
jgi:transcriptional regulator with XRE-family HTH domain